MKKSLVLLSSVVISSSLFASTSAFATENNEKELKPYSYTDVKEKYFNGIAEEIEDSNQIDAGYADVSNTNYLTEEEVTQVSFSTLATISEELKPYVLSNQYTEKELNEMATDMIKESLGGKARISYEDIPGIGDLNSKEIAIAKKHPIEFANFGATALIALNESKKYYSEAQRTKGNGDAFRHSFWNALMVTYFANNSGPAHGVERATAWATAHEANASGIDKEMDLINNEIGRQYAYVNFTYTQSKFSSGLRSMVKQGTLVRIVKENLVATNGTTGM